MCGIAGYVGEGDERDADRMIRAIAHRGPDDMGIFHEQGLGLAHARLSIIDLSPAGHEPMWNSDRTVVLVFNGEIYNFEEIREREVPAYAYAGHSDAEVILAMYEKYGAECFRYFNGMFAIGLWDTRTRTLLLARDRMGKKPLYWGIFQGSLLFASEPKAILAHPLARRELNLSAVNAYLSLDYVPTPLSIWQGISKLEPATVLQFRNGEVETACFWQPDFSELREDERSMLAQLDERLRTATASRLISDVPLGIFLSGGLDSSVVAYYASRASAASLHTFSIGFSEKSFDESAYAKEVATHLHANHHHRVFTDEDARESIPKLYALLDEPLADASIIPTYLLSQFARTKVTVALGGDGGDELFAGYPTFQAEKLYRMYRRIPSVVREWLIKPMISFLPASERYMSLSFKLQKFIEGAEESNMLKRHMRWLGTFSLKERKELYTEAAWNRVSKEEVHVQAQKWFEESGSEDEHNKLLYAYQRTYLMDQVLVKVDRASMQHALETRTPLLDFNVVEFANRLPYRFKLRGFKTKYALKEIMSGKLPSGIRNRKKQGFGVPVAKWLRGPLKEWGHQLLTDEVLYAQDLFNRAYLLRLWDEHQSGKRNHAKKLWNILVLALFLREL